MRICPRAFKESKVFEVSCLPTVGINAAVLENVSAAT